MSCSICYAASGTTDDFLYELLTAFCWIASCSVAGFWGTLTDTPWFIAEQIPNSAVVPVTEGAIVVAWQLGNLYLLMAMMGLAILNTTSEAKVVRAYLVVLWLGDIGHIGFTAYGLGRERLANVSGWNTLTTANVAFTVRKNTKTCHLTSETEETLLKQEDHPCSCSCS